MWHAYCRAYGSPRVKFKGGKKCLTASNFNGTKQLLIVINLPLKGAKTPAQPVADVMLYSIMSYNVT